MKPMTWTTVLAASLAVAVLTTGCSKSGEAAQQKVQVGPESAPLSPGEVDEAIHEGKSIVVIDVREPGEFADGRIPSAKNIPLRDVQARAAEIPRDQEVVLVCRSGNRSEVAWEQLLKLGYTRVHNMEGGMKAWQGEVTR